MAGLGMLSDAALVGAGNCVEFGGCTFGEVVVAGCGLIWLGVLWRYWRSSDKDMAPGTGWGECRGESPRGELVKCVPKVGAPCELRAPALGVVGPFGTAKGPVCVGVMALVVVAMAQ